MYFVGTISIFIKTWSHLS